MAAYEAALSGAEHRTIIRESEVLPEILAVAGEKKIDTIVMASHGRAAAPSAARQQGAQRVSARTAPFISSAAPASIRARAAAHEKRRVKCRRVFINGPGKGAAGRCGH